ncbi:PhzF family phenazine biosynthesis protein [Sphingomonas sp. RB56-2]|uniref:PhzF family phenazine biosynthesis protein n=1 Tax=Sphingomonas brevis TaxID=2908206 RepID=A0ABT0S9V3_9SPHN|nr:PhzF family phenazine biosynthesis protein [Sphingomonas brevis]MCL6741117.1 PhzF family phenazine biosynthesis protein [Sphingomonas brevis]
MTTPLPIFQVDAFAERPFAGNPAAVMPLSEWLPDDVMQAIGAENNLAETAFTVPSERDDADYDLRWFTPTLEIGMCGHATLAAAHILLHGDRIRFATHSGILTVTRDADDPSLLKLDMPSAPPQPEKLPELLEALGIEGETFVSRAGNGNAVVLVTDEAAVRTVAPDFLALRKLPYLVSVTAPGDEQDVASRVFAAYHGIDEDPVTGSAHTALIPFWAGRLGRHRFSALQASKRTGLIDCELKGDRVILGGHAVTVIEGYFQI